MWSSDDVVLWLMSSSCEDLVMNIVLQTYDQRQHILLRCFMSQQVLQAFIL